MPNNKYKAKPTIINGLRFDSQLEGEVYKLLTEYWYSLEFIESQELHVHPMMFIDEPFTNHLRNETYPFRYPCIWKPDFLIKKFESQPITWDNVHHLIEVKGVFMPDFGLKLRLLAATNLFDFRNLIIVTNNQRIPRYCQHLTIMSLAGFKNYLKLRVNS